VPVPHLYVHVPFCARRCSYCDFSIAVRSATPVDEYLDALRKELAGLSQDLDRSTLDTVYLGGGTPSRLGGSGIEDLLETVRIYAEVANGAEITLEANPDDVNDVAVAHWVGAGVNRVSLGSQSFDPHALEWMHRTHTAGQIGTAVETLRRGGINNISLDLIFALPGHLNRSWKRDLESALELTPNHLSLYGLTVEAQTPISRWAMRGASVQGSEEEYEQEFIEANATLSDAGFDHYEVSNFARPGFQSHHNSAYWTGAAYVGVGPSAHSFDGATRRWNVSAYAEWIRRLNTGESVVAGAESLTSENRDAEEVYLGLRTKRGLPVSEAQLPGIRRWEEAGWAVLDDPLDQPRVRLTPTGWLRLDSLAAELAARRARSGAPTLGATPSHCYI
jgi:oxygen-independent coproporphyrinogen-3 oxidase